MVPPSNPNNGSNFLRDTVGRSWWVILLFGIFSALFGVMALVNPLGAGAGLTWAIGVLAIAEGVVGLIGAFGKGAGVSRGWMIFYAAVSILFGVMAVMNPLSMAATIATVTGFWFIFSGVMRIVWAVRVRKEIDNEWLLILGGVISIVLGGLLVAAPVAGVLVGAIWIGIGALVYGLLQIWAAFKLRKLSA
ncbi:HdeD family acid-resistance protein [Diaphorobacter sp. HDW4A]|uniref:HdeD family acid-resistance protein n=1 Tax=Diaphorobacter sp. HDW4A TaxID=2714924 RepID=UPI00140C02FF|nr:HdeD family acid-resistance protein [Diaphorobacter sp. HDW4A]QIL82074.1 HdeD family acid-resistance protein [Diaphorobacter sp. HDW4A]